MVHDGLWDVYNDMHMGNTGEVIAEGRSIGSKIGIGKALIIPSANDMDNLKEGDILITDMTDPDWEPIMKKASDA